MLKEKSVKHEHHANAAEEGETANIRQNTTNKGFFRGRRLGLIGEPVRNCVSGVPKRSVLKIRFECSILYRLLS